MMLAHDLYSCSFSRPVLWVTVLIPCLDTKVLAILAHQGRHTTLQHSRNSLNFSVPAKNLLLQIS
jgi:hypothetical protein